MTPNEDPSGGLDDHQENERRIGIESARTMLGMIARNYEDDDVLEALEILYGIAEEAFERFAQDPKQTPPDD